MPPTLTSGRGGLAPGIPGWPPYAGGACPYCGAAGAAPYVGGAVGSLVLSHAPVLRKGLAPELEFHSTKASLAIDRISGKSAVDGHQAFQMPEYWERFRRDESKPGYLPAHIRILVLTHYVHSIQVTD